MGYFSDAWSSISSAFGSSDSGSQAAAPISSASGELTDAGKAMGGQSAVDANMAAGADKESAWGNFFHGMTGDNTTGGSNASSQQLLDAMKENRKNDAERKAAEEQEMMAAHKAGMRNGGGGSLPRIQSGDVQQYNPLEYQVKPITPSAGPFTGALNDIKQPFQV